MQLKVWENVSVSFSRLSLLESEMRRRCREVCPTGLPARNLIQLSHSFHSGSADAGRSGRAVVRGGGQLPDPGDIVGSALRYEVRLVRWDIIRLRGTTCCPRRCRACCPCRYSSRW